MIKAIIILRTYIGAAVQTHWDELDFREEARADRDERLFRPLVEPVDGRAVDDGGELPPTHAEGGANGGEAQHHLELPADAVNEEAPAVLPRVLNPCTLDLVANASDDVLKFVTCRVDNTVT